MEYEHLTAEITGLSRKNPGRVAVVHGARHITYSELEKRTNRMANFFYTRYRGKEIPAVNPKALILLDRSPGLIITLIALLKCGIIFVPLDPEFPGNRIGLLLKETCPDMLVISPASYRKFKDIFDRQEKQPPFFLFDDRIGGIESAADDGNSGVLQFERIYNRYAYIYFTSGSTGPPKGVMGRHKSLSHFIEWEIKEFGIDEEFNISLLTSPSFDAVLRDIFVPLKAGGICRIPGNGILQNPGRLLAWFDREKITLVHTVPSFFKTLLPGIENAGSLLNLRFILLSGELLRGRDIKHFLEIFKDRIQLVNLYGPTETTMIKVFYRIKKGDADIPIIPVGKAMAGAQVLVLDGEMRKSLTGNVGEIYIRTPYMTAGYFNDSESNKKVFLPNPFSENPRDFIYKTGDSGRWLLDGNLEVTGRTDDQVKIRGVRVELAEIENQLLAHKSIAEAVVTAREKEDGEKYLCAYFIKTQDTVLPGLREYLAQILPGYMVPSHFIELDKMPLKPNGKVDKQALPDPSIAVDAKREVTAPQNEIQAKLVGIWSEILSVKEEKIGIDDDFFYLGGHSLRAMNMISLIKKVFGIDLSLRIIFKELTIRGIAQYLGKNRQIMYDAIQPAEKKYYYELSSAQKRLFFLHMMEGDRSAGYNMRRVVQIDGKVDRSRLKKTFASLIKRHESLRTSFHIVGENPVQRIHHFSDLVFDIEYHDMLENKNFASRNLTTGSEQESAATIGDLIRRFGRAFDLSEPPLLRVGLIHVAHRDSSSKKKLSREKCAESLSAVGPIEVGGETISGDRCILIVEMHHIVSDGTSMTTLIEDFLHLYAGERLAPLQLRYRDFSTWQNRLFAGGEINRQEDYWLDLLAGAGGMPRLNLPTDFERPEIYSFAGDSYGFQLETKTAARLRKMGLECGVTLYMNLLAILNVLFYRYTGQEDIIIGSGDAGRFHPDLQGIIGMFVNTRGMRHFPGGNKPYSQFLQEVKENCLKAFENKDARFEILVEKLNLVRESSRCNPLFDIFLGVQNYETAVIEEKYMKETSFRYYRSEHLVARFDMTFYVFEIGDSIYFSIEYATALFKQATIMEISRHLIEIIDQVIADRDKPLKDFTISLDFATVNPPVTEDYREDFGFE